MFRRERVIQYTYVIIDLIFIVISFYIPFLINFYFTDVDYSHNVYVDLYQTELPFISLLLFIFLMWSIVVVLFLKNFRLHQTARDISAMQECALVMKALFFSAMPVATAIFILKIKILSPLVFVESFFLMLFFLTLWRLLKRFFVRYIVSRGYNIQNVLIVGCNDEVKNIIHEVKQYPHLGLNIAGFICDDDEPPVPVIGCPLLGKTNEIEKIIQTNFIDEIIIASRTAESKIPEIIMTGQKFDISVKVVPNVHELLLGRPSLTYCGKVPVIQYSAKGIHGANLVMKRLFDLIFSFFALICLVPVFVIISVMIITEDRRPVFYVSKRSGKKGRVFNLYKFRTMHVDAEKLQNELLENKESTGPIFKMKNDPRITRVGKFIRKHSLDELPQLLNVLNGDMSLVGPRPLSLGEIERDDMRQLKRLEIKPGMTCLWQIQGRSDLSFEMLLKWDLWYIENWSFWLDLKIILLTFPAIIKGEGAY